MSKRKTNSYTPFHQEGNGDTPFQRVNGGESVEGNFKHIVAMNGSAIMDACVTGNDGDTVEEDDEILQGQVVSGQFTTVAVKTGLVFAYEQIEE